MDRFARSAAIVLPALAIGVVVAIAVVYFQRGFLPGDAVVYLAAGERLDAGHPLYAISPGDRPIVPQPPYWTVPLLSPPLIAVLFRPLALLPDDLGATVWWLMCIALIAGTVLAMLRRRPIPIAIAVLVLSVPLVYELGVGNVNAVILAGIVGAWLLLRDDHDEWAGVLFAVLAGLKVTPAVAVWWLLTQRRIRGLWGFIIGTAAVAIVSLAGAGLSAHLDYIGIIRQTGAVGTSELSLAGIARSLGATPTLAALLPPVAVAIGAIAVWLLRERPGPAYAVMVVTMLAGSPVVNINWFALLLSALAPLAWPLRTPDATEPGGSPPAASQSRATR